MPNQLPPGSLQARAGLASWPVSALPVSRHAWHSLEELKLHQPVTGYQVEAGDEVGMRCARRSRHDLTRDGVDQCHATGVVAVVNERVPPDYCHARDVPNVLAGEALATGPDRVHRLHETFDPADREIRPQ